MVHINISLIKEIDHASNPVVLVPESFTLACETEIVNSTGGKGIFDLQIFSPSSLIREIRELTWTFGRCASRTEEKPDKKDAKKDAKAKEKAEKKEAKAEKKKEQEQ